MACFWESCFNKVHRDAADFALLCAPSTFLEIEFNVWQKRFPYIIGFSLHVNKYSVLTDSGYSLCKKKPVCVELILSEKALMKHT